MSPDLGQDGFGGSQPDQGTDLGVAFLAYWKPSQAALNTNQQLLQLSSPTDE